MATLSAPNTVQHACVHRCQYYQLCLLFQSTSTNTKEEIEAYKTKESKFALMEYEEMCISLQNTNAIAKKFKEFSIFINVIEEKKKQQIDMLRLANDVKEE